MILGETRGEDTTGLSTRGIMATVQTIPETWSPRQPGCLDALDESLLGEEKQDDNRDDHQH